MRTGWLDIDVAGALGLLIGVIAVAARIRSHRAAVTELASGQLVTGTARFAGAMVVLFKLTFGSIAGAQIVSALGWTPRTSQVMSLPPAIEVVATIAAAFSFAILFRVAGRPGTLVRLPAIMLLVPGSVGFRGLASLTERVYTLGLETGVAVLSALVALMA